MRVFVTTEHGSPLDREGTDAPMCQDTRSGGLNDLLASAEIGHDALVDLSRKEAFEAPDDLAFGSAIGGASGDVVAGGLVESHADDDGAIEGGVGVGAHTEALAEGRCCLGCEAREVLVVYRNFLGESDPAAGKRCFRHQLLLVWCEKAAEPPGRIAARATDRR